MHNNQYTKKGIEQELIEEFMTNVTAKYKEKYPRKGARKLSDEAEVILAWSGTFARRVIKKALNAERNL